MSVGVAATSLGGVFGAFSGRGKHKTSRISPYKIEEARRKRLREEATARGESVFFGPNPYIEGATTSGSQTDLLRLLNGGDPLASLGFSQEYQDYLSQNEALQFRADRINNPETGSLLTIAPAESFLSIQNATEDENLSISDAGLPDF